MVIQNFKLSNEWLYNRNTECQYINLNLNHGPGDMDWYVFEPQMVEKMKKLANQEEILTIDE